MAWGVARLHFTGMRPFRRPVRAEDRANLPNGSSRSARAAPKNQTVLLSEAFYWRDLAFGCNRSASLFFADDGTTEFRDFFVDLVKRALGELLRWREVFLKISYVLLRAFDLI